MEKAALYCRLSKEDQDKDYIQESESIQNQKRMLADYALLGIGFISIIDNGDTRISGNKKIRQINGLINEWYSEDLSENIRKVLRQKMETGQFIGSFACYGYEKNPKDRHKLIVDKEAASIVKRIYNLYADGLSISQIGELLTREKILTPTFYKQRKGSSYKNSRARLGQVESGIWSTSTIKRILENRTYTGCLIQGREKKLSYKSKKIILAPKKDWIILENNHDPIISKELYLKVENLRKERRKN